MPASINQAPIVAAGRAVTEGHASPKHRARVGSQPAAAPSVSGWFSLVRAFHKLERPPLQFFSRTPWGTTAFKFCRVAAFLCPCMALTPEDVLRKLAKLPENTVCLNCGTEDKIFGFKNIVVKFRTFVCGHCKAAHQSFSHRVKELNQSTFTMAEVELLRPSNGGSNNAARRTWLARVPPDFRGRPCPGDPLPKFKEFILAAYENRQWCVWGARAAAAAAAAPHSHRSPAPRFTPPTSRAQVQRRRGRRRRQQQRRRWGRDRLLEH